jgi:hypothetical protein
MKDSQNYYVFEKLLATILVLEQKEVGVVDVIVW